MGGFVPPGVYFSRQSWYKIKSTKASGGGNMGKAYYNYLEFNNAELFTMVFLPEEQGKFPTVIMRKPYVDETEDMSEEDICEKLLVTLRRWLDGGFAFVYQHCRGRGKSTGDCIPYIFEREDGLFLQDWVRQQPFYNGEIYLYGHSYLAAVQYVTSPFADDIKGAVLMSKDCERYNCIYRNGIFKTGLHGVWYVKMYKNKTMKEKNYTDESFLMLPLSDFTQTVFGERAEDFDEALKHPDRNDPFWTTRYGGGEAHNAVKHARIPILLITGFYDVFTGGVFDMWNTLDEETKAMSAIAVHPFKHAYASDGEPIAFENGDIRKAFKNFPVTWLNSVRGKCEPPFEKGKITYYKLFENKWCCDDFYTAEQYQKIALGKETVTYRYDPNDPANFKGGLSANFGSNEWQDLPFQRDDIITVYTPEFTEDTFIKGKIKAKLRVRSDCEDTGFYMRLSLCKPEGDYGLRDDINQISNFCPEYTPNTELDMDFCFDEHAFVIQKGEKLRIDISSSAFPLYVRHTNNKGLFSEQTTVRIANNSVDLEKSYIEIPISK